MPKPIDIQRFVQEQRKQLDQFERYWSKMSSRDPKMYPNELPPGDWDEQYLAWCQVTNPKESAT